jgi:DNA-binding NarL/FixJ family response regulator
VIRVLVVAPSAIARTGLAAIVRADAQLEIAGEATPLEAAARVADLDPDVVLEQRDRGAAVGYAGTPSVVLVDEPHAALAGEMVFGDLVRAESSPGFGMLSRDATREEVVAALVAAAAGLVAFQPRMMAKLNAGTAPRAALDESIAEPLTRRERDVLAQLARGATNRTIAARLGISEHTVKFHIGSILAKLGASTRTEAVSRGLQLGMVML